MGLYDTITVVTYCPVCGKLHAIEFQTKDLGRRMYHYEPLPEDWFIIERGFRKNLPVFPRTVYDKSHIVWKNQAEKVEAMAKIPQEEELKRLKHVNVIGECSGKWIHAKIPIENGFLINKLKNIELKDADYDKCIFCNKVCSEKLCKACQKKLEKHLKAFFDFAKKNKDLERDNLVKMYLKRLRK